jgi:hypothetical protein
VIVCIITRYSYPTSMKLAFSRQIFEKSSNVRFHEIRSVGTELLYEDRQINGQTGKIHNESNSHFSLLCEGDLNRIQILINFTLIFIFPIFLFAHMRRGFSGVDLS